MPTQEAGSNPLVAGEVIIRHQQRKQRQELPGTPRGVVGRPMRKMMVWVMLHGLRRPVSQLLPLKKLHNTEKEDHNLIHPAKRMRI